MLVHFLLNVVCYVKVIDQFTMCCLLLRICYFKSTMFLIWCSVRLDYGKPLWTKLLKLPHSVPISSKANSIPKTHTKLYIKLHTKFNTSNSIQNIHHTNTPYQTQDQKPISNSRSKTHIRLNNKFPTKFNYFKLNTKHPY